MSAAVKLTAAQRQVLAYHRDHGGRYIESGRYGHPTGTLEAMARKGLVVLVRKRTWDSAWSLTDAGRAALAEVKS